MGNNENGNSVTLENCYYLDTVGIGGVAGTDDENTKATLEDDMKKSSFANSLGGAFKYDSKKLMEDIHCYHGNNSIFILTKITKFCII